MKPHPACCDCGGDLKPSIIFNYRCPKCRAKNGMKTRNGKPTKPKKEKA